VGRMMLAGQVESTFDRHRDRDQLDQYRSLDSLPTHRALRADADCIDAAIRLLSAKEHSWFVWSRHCAETKTVAFSGR